VRERELQTLGDELLEVWALDIRSLLNFDNFENLKFREKITH